MITWYRQLSQTSNSCFISSSYWFEAEKFWPRIAGHCFGFRAGWETWSVREVPANFDKYSWGNICELLAEYLSFVWKIFVAESELRSACKSGSLVTGYLQMIKGSQQCQPFGDVLLAGGCADSTYTLDCCRAFPWPEGHKRWSWENLLWICKYPTSVSFLRDFDENMKWKRRGVEHQEVFFPFLRNLTFFLLLLILVLVLVLLAGGCADCTHCVHTLHCRRAPPDQM